MVLILAKNGFELVVLVVAAVEVLVVVVIVVLSVQLRVKKQDIGIPTHERGITSKAVYQPNIQVEEKKSKKEEAKMVEKKPMIAKKSTKKKMHKKASRNILVASAAPSKLRNFPTYCSM
eukprot:553669-Ditylum_brightwellii.AAC.1